MSATIPNGLIELGRRIGQSKVKVGDGFRALILVLRTIMLFAPMRIFLRFGLLLFALGLLYGVIVALREGLGFPEAAVVVMIIGVVSGFFGLIADQISQMRLAVYDRPIYKIVSSARPAAGDICSPESSASPRWRQRLRRSASLVTTAVVLAVLFAYIDVGSVAATLLRAAPLFVGFAVVAEIAKTVVCSLRYQTIQSRVGRTRVSEGSRPRGLCDQPAHRSKENDGEDIRHDEQQEDELDDDIGFGDDFEDVDIHDNPRKKVAHARDSVK